METGCDYQYQSFLAAESESHVQVLGEVTDVDICSVVKAEHSGVSDGSDFQIAEQQNVKRRSGPEDDMGSHSHDDDEIISFRPGHRKKKQSKFWRTVSSSDDEADTLKDHFWKDLEQGLLPEDLVGRDLYSSVRQYFIAGSNLWCHV